MADETTRAPSSDPITFEPPGKGAPDGVAAADAATMSCSKCATPIGAYYYEAGGAVYCARCKRLTEEAEGAQPTGAGAFGRAALFGAGAALGTGVLYGAFIVFAQWDLALIAIGVGALVALAIRKGSRGRGGRRFQVLAVVLAYLAVGLAHIPVALATLEESRTEQGAASATRSDSAASTSSRDSTAGTARDSAGAVASARAERADSAAARASSHTVLAFILGAIILSIESPFIQLSHGDVISAIIIGVGLLQAWRMTAAGGVAPGGRTFTGPYKVASGPAAP